MKRNNALFCKVTLLTTLLLCFVMLEGQFAGGSGTVADPWQIETAVHLNNIRNYLGTAHSNKHFIQTADIDLSDATKEGGDFWNNGEGWEPIGDFCGSFNGDVYDIEGLTINRDAHCQGLFGYTDGATLSNIKLVNVNIALKTKSNGGGLIGWSNNTEVTNCSSTGSITGNDRLGGLIGWSDKTNVTNCSTTGSIEGRDYGGGLVGKVSVGTLTNCWTDVKITSTGYYVGGLVGDKEVSGMISGCYALGNSSADWYLGGLVGYNKSNITNCYSTGQVVSNGGNVGGFVGYNIGTVTNCYSTGQVVLNGSGSVGGFVGVYYGTINNCYWDKETSGKDKSAGGEGVTTAQMTYPHTGAYTSWDFTDTWVADKRLAVNWGYPYLKWQPVPDYPDADEEDFVEVTANQIIPIDFEKVTIAFQGDNPTQKLYFALYNEEPGGDKPEEIDNLSPFFITINNNVTAPGTYDLTINITGIPGIGTPKELVLLKRGNPTKPWVSLGTPDELASDKDWGPLLTWQGLTSFSDFALGGKDEHNNTLPVELTSFTASITNKGFIQLRWVTQTELNMLGYYIYRGQTNNLEDAVIIIPNIIVATNSSEPKEYKFVDEDVVYGLTYYYWLQSNSLDLSYCFYGPVRVQLEEEDEVTTPDCNTELIGAYPNPFNPGTNIRFSLEEKANVTISIHNMKGQKIRDLIIKKEYPKGSIHSVYWDGMNNDGQATSSGAYIYRMKTDGGYNETKKMMMIK